MKNFSYKPSGVCPRQIDFALEDGKIHDVKFYGGCPGNTKAVAKLIEGMDAAKVVELLKGNLCGAKGTSCADQLATAVSEATGKSEN